MRSGTPCRDAVASGFRWGATELPMEVHMSQVTDLLAQIRHDEEGQGLAEYALILALIAIVAIVALIFLGGQVSSILSNVGNSI